MYTLYGWAATRSLRVAWTLEALSLPYNYEPINLRAGEHLSASYRAINPAGKVPFLKSNEVSLFESAAIITYLADKHAPDDLIPNAGTPARAELEQVMYFLVTELEQPLWSKAKHTFALPEHIRLPAMLETANWEFKRALKTFVGLLGDNPYLCGEGFTIADIVAAHLLTWATEASVETLPPQVERYRLSMMKRDACIRAIEREKAACSVK